ncbi:MAG: ribbon-helix-helix domain-containing protein [Actinobacteria bacterium]|nr:ribbon-helix-helix domain-containing protein [Actinomycetota bacterium]
MLGDVFVLAFGGAGRRITMPYALPTSVRKTSVYLDEADAQRLAMLAEREGVSQASVLRRAIRAYVPHPRESATLALDGVGEGPGGSVADLDSSPLLEGFGE